MNGQLSEQPLAELIREISSKSLGGRLRIEHERVKVLCAQNLLTPSAAEQVQTKQISDILRLALLWTEGTWDFDSRSRLNEQLNFKINAGSLLLEAGRRLPPKFAASSFNNPGELITP